MSSIYSLRQRGSWRQRRAGSRQLRAGSRRLPAGGGPLRWLWAGLLSLAFTSLAQAQVKILDTGFVSLPGNRMEVRIDFDQAPPLPRTYMIENPPRLVLDLFGVSNGLETRSIAIQSGQVDSLELADTGERVRLVAKLYESVEYDSYVEGNSLFIQFGSGAGGPVPETAAEVAAEATAPAKAPESADVADSQQPPLQQEPQPQPEQQARSEPQAAPRQVAPEDPARAAEQARTRVTGIDFRSLDGDVGRVILTLSDAQAGVDIVEEGTNVVVNLMGAQLPADLEQRLDVQDFSTPVLFIDALADGLNTSLLIKPGAEPYDYLAYQADNRLVLDFKPVTDLAQEERQRERFPYTGEKLSLNFQDIDIRSVLQIIADVTDMNLVVSDTVSGNITLRLKNVPWDQALELILKTKSLDKRIVGNVMMVAPAAEIAERERFEIETNKQVQELAPLSTEFLQINYAKASEVVGLLGQEQGLLSERGSVKADPRTNMLLIKDTASNISKVRRALKKLDVPVRQVMIEARIVTINADYTKELGIKWGAGYVDANADRSIVFGSTAGEVTQAGGGGALNVPTGLNVDLGATNIGASQFAIGIGDNTSLLQMELSALENDGKGEVVSQPKIITANGKQARIQSGEEIPFQTVEDGEVNVEFKEVVLALDVTPQITPDNRLILDLTVNQDTRGETLPNGEVGINTNELQTQVLIDNGKTLVLGGVFEKNSTQSLSKVPLLGDLPYIGRLFQRKLNIENKDELLVFITPRIVEESINVR